MLYLIEILHQTTTRLQPIWITSCCILSKFYIKPQQGPSSPAWSSRCILSKFYIKPQLAELKDRNASCCILSKFYIKPQRTSGRLRLSDVVSYRNSTSNHNHFLFGQLLLLLYLIEILHQTTTSSARTARLNGCILSKFYIKPQHLALNGGRWSGCILSKFYIKPQLQSRCR